MIGQPRAHGEETIVTITIEVIQPVVEALKANARLVGEFRLGANADHPADLIVPAIA
jgi:hypothetical protein